VPLHLTKVAYGAQSMEELHSWFANRGDEARLTTRYLPKRAGEIAPGGSLYWVYKHQLVARSEILPKRAHQGWRYLADEDAPRDLADGEVAGDVMPGKLAGALARLGLV
jgi:hypothetical protein